MCVLCVCVFVFCVVGGGVCVPQCEQGRAQMEENQREIAAHFGQIKQTVQTLFQGLEEVSGTWSCRLLLVLVCC